jgi:hypothetical protein
MPDTPALRVGGGNAFRLAQGCPVASRWGSGEYVAHQGDANGFLLADARTRDGTAAIRLALWRCVHCGMLLTGIAQAEGDPDSTQDFTWMEETVVLLGSGNKLDQD